MTAVANIYTVNVKSRFDLFLNDDIGEDDPEELLEKIKKEKLLEKESREKAKKEKAPKKPAGAKDSDKTAQGKDQSKSESNGNEKENITSVKKQESRGDHGQAGDRPPRFRGGGNQRGDRHSSGTGGYGELQDDLTGESRPPRGGGRGGGGFVGRGGVSSRGSSRGGGSFRGSRGGGPRPSTGEDRDQEAPMQTDSAGPNAGFDTADSGMDRPERGRGRGRGGFGSFDRGGRGSRGGSRGRGAGGRDFDRHSGSDRTGIKSTDKREGGGAHNWGTVDDGIEEGQQVASGEPTAQQVGGTDEAAAPATTGGDDAAEQPTESAAVVEEEQGPAQMTLIEWKARQGTNRVQVGGTVSGRKANEGNKDPFGDMVAYRKPKDVKTDQEGDEEGEDEEAEEEHKKKTLPINILFNDSRRGGGGSDSRDDGPRRGGRGGGGGFRGGRGGRGGGEGGPSRGGRGGRGGGGGRGGAHATPAANIRLDNEDDFPTLK